ncbi:MAG: PorT family protein [Muribaculaceae bacterium]|nr:PorT family protein [Muribaculaceae bacterium]
MKLRPFLAVIVLMLGTVMLSAQTHYEGNIAVGGKAGITLSRIQFNPTVPQSMLMGFMMGATFRYMEERHFGLIAEVNLEQRGWKEKFEGYDYAYQRRFTYLQVPMLTHIYFGSNKFHGFFNAGPEIGFMIAHSTTSNFDYENVAGIADFPTANRSIAQFVEPIHNKLDYGISVGAGMEMIARNRSSFTLEGRFYYGLNDVFSNHKKDVFSASSGMSIMVTLGYMYRVK